MTIRRSKIIGIVSIILVAATMYGCLEKVYYYYYMTSYVQEWVLISKLELKSEFNDTIRLLTHKRSVSFRSKGEDKEYFDMLCEKYEDTSYNREVGLVYDVISGRCRCITPAITSINVVSDKDFDKGHPAGTFLNDCVEMNFASAYKYIKSKYSDEASCQYQKKLLSEILSDEMIMMVDNICLSFIKLPETADIHMLTVTMHDEYGNEYSDTIEFDFSKLTDTL